MGPLIAIAYITHFSFDSLMWVTLGLMAFTLLCSFFTKTNSNNEEEKPKPKENKKEPFYAYMFDKRVLLPCILVSLNYMTIAGTVNFMGAFGKEIGVGGNISYFFIAQGIAMVLVRIFSGRIFDRFGHRILIIPAAISGAAGLILLGFSTGMIMVLVAGILFGIAFGVIHPIVQAWALTLVPPEKKATANSMLLIFIDFGLAAGSIGLGYLAGIVGYGMTYVYSASLMVIILVIYLFGSKKVKAVEIAS